jgi:hypothetical protein
MPYEALLTELVKILPQSVVIIIVLVITNSHNKSILKQLTDSFSKQIEANKVAYKDASEQLRANVKLINEMAAEQKTKD